MPFDRTLLQSANHHVRVERGPTCVECVVVVVGTGAAGHRQEHQDGTREQARQHRFHVAVQLPHQEHSD